MLGRPNMNYKSEKVKIAIITGAFVVVAAIVTGVFQLFPKNSPVVQQDFYVQQSSESISQDNPSVNPDKSAHAGQEKTTSPTKQTKLKDMNIFNTQYFDDAWQSTDFIVWKPLTDKAADGNIYEDGFLLQIFQPYHTKFKVEYLLNKQYTNFSTGFLLTDAFKSTSNVYVLKIIGDDTELYVSPKITGGFIPAETGNVDITNVVKLTIEVESTEKSHGNSGGILLTNPILK